jgi:hypothetical protein
MAVRMKTTRKPSRRYNLRCYKKVSGSWQKTGLARSQSSTPHPGFTVTQKAAKNLLEDVYKMRHRERENPSFRPSDDISKLDSTTLSLGTCFDLECAVRCYYLEWCDKARDFALKLAFEEVFATVVDEAAWYENMTKWIHKSIDCECNV